MLRKAEWSLYYLSPVRCCCCEMIKCKTGRCNLGCCRRTRRRDAICFAVVQFRHAAQKRAPRTPCDCCLFSFQQLNKMLLVFFSPFKCTTHHDNFLEAMLCSRNEFFKFCHLGAVMFSKIVSFRRELRRSFETVCVFGCGSFALRDSVFWPNYRRVSRVRKKGERPGLPLEY
jgi:hypothetical protein